MKRRTRNDPEDDRDNDMVEYDEEGVRTIGVGTLLERGEMAKLFCCGERWCLFFLVKKFETRPRCVKWELRDRTTRNSRRVVVYFARKSQCFENDKHGS